MTLPAAADGLLGHSEEMKSVMNPFGVAGIEWNVEIRLWTNL